MAAYHYLGFKHLVGESTRYVALLEEQWIALLGWSSAAFKSAPRDQWIGWSEEQRPQRLKFLANNSRYLILPGILVKNLASKTLALNLKHLSADWLADYGHPVLLAETFVDLCASLELVIVPPDSYHWAKPGSLAVMPTDILSMEKQRPF